MLLLVSELLTAFADVYSFALLASNAHWNTSGSNFYAHHLLYDRVYKESYANVDRLAEYLRGVGVRAPATLALLSELTTLVPVTGVLPAGSYLDALVTANTAVLKSVYEANSALATSTDPRSLGGMNLLGGISETHCSLGFLLSSAVA